LVLILSGALVFLLTFISAFKGFLTQRLTQRSALVLLLALIAYGLLV